MVLSRKEKQLNCIVIKRRSETSVSCFEVHMGLACFQVPGVRAGVGKKPS